MPLRHSFSVLLLSALLLSTSPAFSAGGSAPRGEVISPRCEAAIDMAAGRYSQCLLKASAKYAKKGKKGNHQRLFARRLKCEDTFQGQVARAQARFGEDSCSPYAREIADRTAVYVGNVSSEAQGSRKPSLLFVQNASGGTLTETTLTLTGVSSQTAWFTDRPYRESGQKTTEHFLEQWGDGDSSFVNDPPNADLACEVDGKVKNQVVILKEPVLDQIGGTLTYTTTLVSFDGDTDTFEDIVCEGDAHLFIDSLGSGASSASFQRSFDVTQGFYFRENISAPVGFLTSLKIGDTVFASDFAVRDPEGSGAEMQVVGVLSFLGWTGYSGDPINVTVQLSEASRNLFNGLTNEEKTKAEIDFAFSSYSYDKNAGAYYKSIHTNGIALKGGRTWGTAISSQPGSVVPDPTNYWFSMAVGPTESDQQIHFATSESDSDRSIIRWMKERWVHPE